MFEMFVLLVNEINPHSFCFVTCFLFIFTCEALLHRGLVHIIFCIAYFRSSCGNLPREFSVAICRRNLPWLFAARICHGYLPWAFCTHKRVLFCTCEQILLIWKQTFFICKQNVLICEIFFINSVSFCYCCGSYGPPY